MKRVKISVLLLAATVVFSLLLAACSDGTGQGEYATVTISLASADTSRRLVDLAATGKDIPNHEYTLIVKNSSGSGDNININMTVDSVTGHLTASGVPTGSKILEVRAYGNPDEIWGPDDHPFEPETSVLRAIGVSGPVTINRGSNNNISTIEMYSATDVENWEELEFAAGGATDPIRKEIIILRDSMDATSTIPIARPIELRAEGGAVTITRKGDFYGAFFSVVSANPNAGTTAGKLAIGATFTGSSSGSAIILDGGKTDNDTTSLPATAPLIISAGDCAIGSNVTLRNNQNNSISGSTTAPGGGVYVSGGTFTLYGKIKDNHAIGEGGGVFMEGGSFVMENGAVISGNTCTGVGGGVFIDGPDGVTSTFTMKGGTIGGDFSNTATSGGGVYIQQPGTGTATFQMNDGSISNNEATGDGGGVYVSNGEFEMVGGEITHNKATYGGGVYVVGKANFKMEGDCAFIGANQAVNGGGVYVENGALTMTGGTIKYNKAENGNGGGVYMNDGAFDISNAGASYDAWVTDNVKTTANSGSLNPSDVYHAGGEIKRDDGSGGTTVFDAPDGGW